MAKTKTSFFCQNCGAESPKWVGKCGSCNEWNTYVEEVIQKLIQHKISGGPVVNEKNELIGIISEGDCIKQISDSRYYNMPFEHNKIEAHMAKNVETIDGNLNIFDAANKFIETKRRRFPIVENGKLVGQISQKDILKAAMKLKGQNWK